MKLEKFKKYGKRNKKIIGSVVGITIIICGVLLFKSFAFFESKYDFDVIKGRIPNFTAGDVTLAFTIDGVKNNDTFPNKNDGYAAKSVTCSNGVTASWDNNLWGLINVVNNGNKKISCNIDFGTILYNVVNVGDLVSYTPTNTSYTIPKSLTGYSSDQKINPSELNLWRVIKKNDTDGTIEAISEYVSNTEVYFFGSYGYNNYSTALDTIAKQYETNGITSGSRYMNNSTDVDLVKAAMPTGIGLKSQKENATDFSNYWYLSGDYQTSKCDGVSKRRIYVTLNVVDTNGDIVDNGAVYYYNECAGANYNDGRKSSVRIIVVFRSGLLMDGFV